MNTLLRLLALCLFAGAAQAHQASTSYLTLSAENAQLSGRWDIALTDLDYAIGLDADGDAQIRWSEVRAAETRIAAYALARLTVSDDERKQCPLQVRSLAIADHSAGRYAVLELRGHCARAAQTLRLDYRLLFDLDAQHRGLLHLRYGGEHGGLFTSAQTQLRFANGAPAPGRVFAEYFTSGVWHVWTGWDHLLFLAALLLPAVLRRDRGRWVPAESLRAVLRETAWTVTAFTLAHALTLSIAASGWLSLPTRWVESAVAATVLFAGLNNLLPIVHKRLFVLAGVFGLIHGAAIAGMLLDLGLPASGRVWALLAFNLGVELAQLAVLAVIVPLGFACRRSAAYRRVVLMPGAVLISLAGLLWLLERALGLKLWPGLLG